MFTKHLDVVYSMVWVLAFANVVGVLMSLCFVGQLAKMTFLKISIIIPLILSFALLGSYLATGNFGDIFVTLAMGGLGYGMKTFKFPRGSFVLGMVLGRMSENYLHLSMNLYGLSFLLRPITMLLLSFVIGSIVLQIIRQRRKEKATATGI